MLYCFIISVFILTLNRKTKITLRQSDGKANQLVSVALGNDKQLQCCVSYSASPSRSNVPSSTKNPFDVCRSCRNTVVIKMQLVQGWVWVLVSFVAPKDKGLQAAAGGGQIWSHFWFDCVCWCAVCVFHHVWKQNVWLWCDFLLI